MIYLKIISLVRLYQSKSRAGNLLCIAQILNKKREKVLFPAPSVPYSAKMSPFCATLLKQQANFFVSFSVKHLNIFYILSFYLNHEPKSKKPPPLETVVRLIVKSLRRRLMSRQSSGA